MHTVRFSRDQKRPLACVAHPDKYLGEDKTRGNQQMISDGWATPIPDGDALIEFLARISERTELVKPPPAPQGEPPAQGSLAV
jgi:DNA processing protein